MVKRTPLVLVLCFCLLTGLFHGDADAKKRRSRKKAHTASRSHRPPAAPYQSLLLMDAESGAVLYAENAHKSRPTASLAKMMTALLVLEDIDAGKIHPDDVVQVSRKVSNVGGRRANLQRGEKIIVRELLMATMAHSANDAAAALAEYAGQGIEPFVGRMNARAKELGLSNTRWYTPNGLPRRGDPDTSTAYDLARLGRELLKHPQVLFCSTLKEARIRHNRFTIRNTNKLVRTMPEVDGLKTGFTNAAGFNVVATGVKHERRYIAVVLGSPSSATRFAYAKKLLNKGFSLAESQASVEFDPLRMLKDTLLQQAAALRPEESLVR